MKRAFPWIASALGLTIILLLIIFEPQGSDKTGKLPLLTVLLMAEFGFLVNAAAVFVGVRQFLSSNTSKADLIFLPLNFLLALYLLVTGIHLWPGMNG